MTSDAKENTMDAQKLGTCVAALIRAQVDALDLYDRQEEQALAAVEAAGGRLVGGGQVDNLPDGTSVGEVTDYRTGQVLARWEGGPDDGPWDDAWVHVESVTWGLVPTEVDAPELPGWLVEAIRYGVYDNQAAARTLVEP